MFTLLKGGDSYAKLTEVSARAVKFCHPLTICKDAGTNVTLKDLT